jgi:hypothetical protein
MLGTGITSNGTQIEVLSEVKSNAYAFRRYKVSLMERGKVHREKSGKIGKISPPKNIVLSENEFIFN